MPSVNEPHHPLDRRLLVYRTIKQTVLLVVAVLLVKFLFIDIVTMRGDQMAPTIIRGDRVLLLRFAALPLIRDIVHSSRKRIAVFTFPSGNMLGHTGRGCLRIAGISGDTITVDSGMLRNSADASLRLPAFGAKPSGEVLPASFAPRDFLPAVRVPAPGDSFVLDSLDLYHFFFTFAAIRQENPASVFLVKPLLLVDGTVQNDYFISDFALYKGALDSVPDKDRYNWFFWDRLSAWLGQTIGDSHKVRLSFAVIKNGARLTYYTVKKRYVFFIADNWDRGLDSRYFGPVAEDRILGRPLCVLWARDKKRLGKIIR